MVYIFEVLKHLSQALLAVLLAAQDFSSMFSVQVFFKEMFWNSKMYTMVETAYGSDLLPVDKHKKLIDNAELLNVI